MPYTSIKEIVNNTVLSYLKDLSNKEKVTNEIVEKINSILNSNEPKHVKTKNLIILRNTHKDNVKCINNTKLSPNFINTCDDLIKKEMSYNSRYNHTNSAFYPLLLKIQLDWIISTIYVNKINTLLTILLAYQ